MNDAAVVVKQLREFSRLIKDFPVATEQVMLRAAKLIESIEADQLARFLSLLAHACSENNIPASTYETLHESIVKLSK